MVLSTTVAGGRGIATTVAGATITVSAIVFSITALSTQMASNQYSPRALGNFFEDTYQQVVIGLVVGTFTYSLVVLASLTNAIVDRSGTTPSVTVTLAAVLGVASVFGIVGYINHSLRRMQIDSVLQRISAAAVEAIESHLDIDPDANHFPIEMPTGPPQVVLARRRGWLTQIEVDQLIEALPDGATARVDVRLGEAISEGDTLMTVWKNESLQLDDAALEGALVSAAERSNTLDPTFGIRQLVDIALKALSPGVNDPTTASDVLHHLKSPIRLVLGSDPPRRVFTGNAAKRVLLVETPSRADYVHTAFTEIRLASGGQPYVLGTLIEVLQDLLGDMNQGDMAGRSGPVEEQLELTVAMVLNSDMPQPDVDRVMARVNSLPTDADLGFASR